MSNDRECRFCGRVVSEKSIEAGTHECDTATLLSRIETLEEQVDMTIEQIETSQAEAAMRVLETLTQWMAQDGLALRAIVIDIDTHGVFSCALHEGGSTFLKSRGGTIQDACAQVAQALLPNEGEGARP